MQFMGFRKSLCLFLMCGLLFLSSCTINQCDPYPVYEARWSSLHEMPEYMAFRYIEEYLRNQPWVNYDQVVRITVRWAYLSQNDPFEMWSIGASVTWNYNVTGYRSRDIVVKIRAIDGEIIN